MFALEAIHDMTLFRMQKNECLLFIYCMNDTKCTQLKYRMVCVYRNRSEKNAFAGVVLPLAL